MSSNKPVLGIIGGTGDLGSGLAARWAAAGYRVIIGSRSVEKAEAGAAALKQSLSARGVNQTDISFAANAVAAAESDIAVLTVPFANQQPTLKEIAPGLQGKILVDTTVPLMPPKVARVQLPAQGSAAQIAQSLLGESVRVVSAFHNVSASTLQSGEPMDCDVLVFGDNKDAREIVVGLAQDAGTRAWHGGSAANSAAAEALTSVLIFINKQYGGHSGIRITGIGDHA